jgi:hypothetical protein
MRLPGTFACHPQMALMARSPKIQNAFPPFAARAWTRRCHSGTNNPVAQPVLHGLGTSVTTSTKNRVTTQS